MALNHSEFTKVITDPDGRCAALLMCKNVLSILPTIEKTKKIPNSHSKMCPIDVIIHVEYSISAVGLDRGYLIDLNEHSIKNVRDLTFVTGCSKPTLIILHEKIPIWTGMLVN